MRLPTFNLLDYDIFPGEKLTTDKLWVESRYVPEERHPFFTAPVKIHGLPLTRNPDAIVPVLLILAFVLMGVLS